MIQNSFKNTWNIQDCQNVSSSKFGKMSNINRQIRCLEPTFGIASFPALSGNLVISKLRAESLLKALRFGVQKAFHELQTSAIGL